MPESLGKEVIMRCFVDADNSGEKLKRHSCSGFIILLQMEPIYYCSKLHIKVETSIFGWEFIAMKLAWKYIRDLRYKIRMVGIPFSDPCFVYRDNKSVLYNNIWPESNLKKKNNSIDYHAVRERVATGEWLNGYDLKDTNISDLLINPVPGGKRRNCFVQGVMYYIWLNWLLVFTPWEFRTRMKSFFFLSDIAVTINN